MANESAAVMKKAVEAIGIAPRTGNVTLLTRKIWNVLLHHAHQLGEQPVYSLKLSDIVRQTSKSGSDAVLVQEHLRKMNAIQIEWNVLNPDGQREWGVSGLIAWAKIKENKGGHVVEWAYQPDLLGRFLNPDMYARISLQIYSGLRSAYAAALYEIACRYVTNPSRLTARHPWQWWRPRLTGTPDDEAKEMEYKYFKRDVLKVAVEEINRLTDLQVELIEHKEGRTVAEIQFSVLPKQQMALELLDNQIDIDRSLIERIKALGLNEKDTAKIYADHGQEKLLATVVMVEERASNKELAPLVSKAAFFKKALRDGYVEMALSEKKAKEKKNAEEKVKQEKRAEENQNGNEQRRRRGEAAMARLKELPEELQEEFRDQFFAEQPQVKPHMKIMLERTFPNWLADQLNI